MDVAEHLRIIWRRKIWIVLASLVVASAVFVWRSQDPEVYQSFSQLKVTTGEEAEGRPPQQDGTIFLAATYADLASSTDVLVRAAELAGTSPGYIRSHTGVSSSRAVGRITVRTTGPRPEAARVINDAVAQALVEAVGLEQQALENDAIAPLQARIDQLRAARLEIDIDDTAELAFNQNQIRDAETKILDRRSQAPNQLSITSAAVASREPIAPTPEKDALLALVVALLLNAELAVGFTIFSDRLSSERDVIRVLDGLDIPVLARIPEGAYDVNVIESFRELRTSLLFLRSETKRQRIAVVSADPGVGKSFVALRIAESLAGAGLKTILIDADLRAPSVHGQLALDRSPGLADALTEPGTQPFFHSLFNSNLRVLTAGRAVDDPAGLLAQDRFSTILDWTSGADVVICDTPPVRLFADPIAVASKCDGFLVVVDVDQARRSELEESINRLRQLGARPLGAVLNRAEVSDRRAYAIDAAPRRSKGRRGRRQNGAEGDNYDAA